MGSLVIIKLHVISTEPKLQIYRKAGNQAGEKQPFDPAAMSGGSDVLATQLLPDCHL